MTGDSTFDIKDYSERFQLRPAEGLHGATCNCYQLLFHGKLHFVKEIKPEYRNDTRMRAAFRKENELGYSLSHPGLPTYVYMGGFFPPEEYVVTEWIEGQTLDKFIEENPSFFLLRKNLENFISCLSETLDYIHKKGIVHADLKPSNIMISNDGKRLKIIDLGYSVSDAHTLTGGFSISFASPDVLGGKKPDVRDDYYSFGKILNYIRPKEDSFFSSLKIGKQIDLLITGGPQQKEKSYYKIKEKISGSKKYLPFPAIILTIGIFLLTWFIWKQLSENKTTEEEIVNKELTSDNDVAITILDNGDEKGNEENPEDNKIENKKNMEGQHNYNTPEPSEPQKPAELQKEDREISIQQNQVNNSSQKYPGSIYPPVADELTLKVQAEVRRLMNIYYPPIIGLINSLEQNNIYTKEWKDSLTRLNEKAVIKCLNIYDYEKKFPTISRGDLFEIVGDESLLYYKENFDDKFFGYLKKVNAMK